MLIPKSKSKLVTTLIHILMWGVFGMIYLSPPITYNIVVPYQLWIKQGIIFSLLVTAYYANSFVFVPKFLLKNRTEIYFLVIISIAAVIIALNIYVDEWLNIRQLMDAAFHKRGPMKHHGGRDHGWDFALLAIIALVMGVSTSITAIQKWQADKQLNQELEQDKVTSELSFLKAQINPHFFFNTLNNIYALTQVDADVAGKAIHQLSRMMRYLLYDTQQAHTLLSQEIAFVKDYISLMQLRLTDVVKVSIDTPKDLQDEPLAPMIFLPFVENAFKHGVSATQQSHIEIVVSQIGKTIYLLVKNSIINDNSISLDTNSGIGLVNTRRRLDLLYPGKYKLDISEMNANNEYTVHLTLDLS